MNDIKTWPIEECRAIWKKIRYSIFVEGGRSLSDSTCVWCMKDSHNCLQCFYGKYYGICTTDLNNNYSNLLFKLRYINAITISNRQYINMINKIEKEAKQK